MKVKTILYHQTIPTGSYANEKIGVEVELSEGDTPEQAFAYAKEMIDKIHRENNPQLYGVQQKETIPIIEKSEYSNVSEMYDAVVKPLTPAEKKQLQIQSTIKQIQEITELKVLESFKLIASKNPELQTAYNNKEKELKQ